jgi:hypothetical protein
MRQRRLTSFFARLRGLGGFGFLRLISLAAGQVLNFSFSFCLPSASFLTWSLCPWACLLNGAFLVNPFSQVFVGDVLQVFSSCPSSHPSYLSLRQTSLSAFFRGHFLRGFGLRNTADVPGFLEVDELTFSAVILVEPTISSLLCFALTGPAPFLSFRLYNWKYTT